MKGKSSCCKIPNKIVCDFYEEFLNIKSNIDRSLLLTWFRNRAKQVEFALDINSDRRTNCKKVKSFCNVSSFIVCIGCVKLILKLSNQDIGIYSFFKLSFLCFFKFRKLFQMRFWNLILYHCSLTNSKHFRAPKWFKVISWVFKSRLWCLRVILFALKYWATYFRFLVRVILSCSLHRSCKGFLWLKH